ncbi:MAG: hypothetical protein WA997_02660, partial [Anaerolineales bacterium]
ILAYLTCARICEKLGDQERRQQIIANGHEQLMKRAEKISDPEWKNVFLEQLPENHQLTVMVGTKADTT